MAGSTILSRLSSSRLKALPVKLKSSKPVLPTISPLKSSSQSQFSSASSSSSSSSVKRISGIPSGAELLNLNDAFAQCGCFGSPQIISCYRISELGFDSSRYLYAFITAPVVSVCLKCKVIVKVYVPCSTSASLVISVNDLRSMSLDGKFAVSG
ncbi:hypothetical protein PVK06_019922 [Gossypium arboreum]|uniref:Uncharacterized protein n=1 Tax=Gossypium arboreum TaxID=29729 RepID=A0ABR0PL92_GOSAR|nr:hypothetical protein PVK06_019922 [Gossypium arboreum]